MLNLQVTYSQHVFSQAPSSRRNYSIDRVKEATFLGVILDEHLTWKSHINNVSSKVSKAVGVIHKSSFCLNNSSLRTLYYSLNYPYFNILLSERLGIDRSHQTSED